MAFRNTTLNYNIRIMAGYLCKHFALNRFRIQDGYKGNNTKAVNPRYKQTKYHVI